VRAKVPDDEDYTGADQLPGGGDRLLGIAEVVRGDVFALLDPGIRSLRGGGNPDDLAGVERP
jgi:hypothetical protein